MLIVEVACAFKIATVKPVLSGPHVKGTPSIRGHQLEPQNFLPTFTVKQTCRQRTHLLSGRGHQY